jgi:hypothetical protein
MGIFLSTDRASQSGCRRVLVLWGLIATFLSGCLAPRATSFVDAAALPPDYVGRSHRASAKEQLLIIEVSQIPGLNVVGFDAFKQDGALYVSPRRVSSGGRHTAQFQIDISKFHLGADWPEHVYWLLNSYAYPIGHPGFWSKEKRAPLPRKKIDIAR